MSDQAGLRAGDRDRDSAAVGEEGITLEEPVEGFDRVYAARTYGELASLVADLPSPPAPAGERRQEFADDLALFTRGMRAVKKTGRWRVPPWFTLDCAWRTAAVDFRLSCAPTWTASCCGCPSTSVATSGCATTESPDDREMPDSR